jgi:hypothetical protein
VETNTFFHSPVCPPPRPLSLLRNRFYPSDRPARYLALRRALVRQPRPTFILACRCLPFTRSSSPPPHVVPSSIATPAHPSRVAARRHLRVNASTRSTPSPGQRLHRIDAICVFVSMLSLPAAAPLIFGSMLPLGHHRRCTTAYPGQLRVGRGFEPHGGRQTVGGNRA